MLNTAVKAQIPIICIRCKDCLNVRAYLNIVLDNASVIKPVKLFDSSAKGTNQVYYIISPTKMDYIARFGWLNQNESTLIIVNPEEITNEMFDAGTLNCPSSLVEKWVSAHYSGEDKEGMLDVFKGLTYKEITEISKIATAKYGKFSPTIINNVKKIITPTTLGLEKVNNVNSFYFPSKNLEKWMALEGRILKQGMSISTQDICRGLLFNGISGCGKTSGAKYIAKELKVPLVRLDIPSLLSKWSGEADHNLQKALKAVEGMNNCVLLVDEVEKLFAADEAGVSQRLLATLLWWLQEHTSKVITIMTTNNMDLLPPELYRPGRLDEVLEFGLLTRDDPKQFVSQYCSHNGIRLTYEESSNVLKGLGGVLGSEISQAKLVGKINKVLKRRMV